MRLLFTIIVTFLTLFTFSCKNKYQRAFEQIDKRPVYLSPEKGEESRQEIALLSDAIQFKPDLPALYFYRAEQYQLFGAYEKAISDHETCIREDWIFGALFYQKGECELALGNLAAAHTDFQKAKKLFQEEWLALPEKRKMPNHWGDPQQEHEEMLQQLEEKIALTGNSE